jgi:hypothetical protein
VIEITFGVSNNSGVCSTVDAADTVVAPIDIEASSKKAINKLVMVLLQFIMLSLLQVIRLLIPLL